MQSYSKIIISIGTEGFEGHFNCSDVGHEEVEMTFEKINQYLDPTYRPKDIKSSSFSAFKLRNRMNSHRCIKNYSLIIPTDEVETFIDYAETETEDFINLMEKNNIQSDKLS